MLDLIKAIEDIKESKRYRQKVFTNEETKRNVEGTVFHVNCVAFFNNYLLCSNHNFHNKSDVLALNKMTRSPRRLRLSEIDVFQW